MNKDRAIDTLKQRKNELTYKKLEWKQIYKEREDTPSAKMRLKEITEEEKALDIAIDSLDKIDKIEEIIDDVFSFSGLNQRNATMYIALEKIKNEIKEKTEK